MPSDLSKVFSGEPTQQDQQVEDLQKELDAERDSRREDRFIFIVIAIILLDVVFFSVLNNFGGPIALIVLELLILIPVARRMGMEEIAKLMDQILNRVTSNIKNKDK